jgi:hypothetical protein
MIKGTARSTEPTNGYGLTIAALVVHVLGPFAFLEAGLASFVIGPPISALTAFGLLIRPFTLLSNFRSDLRSDLDWLENVSFDTLKECSESLSIPAKNDLEVIMKQNYEFANQLYTQFLIWLILAVVLPFSLLTVVIVGNCGRNPKIAWMEFPAFIRYYLVLN